MDAKQQVEGLEPVVEEPIVESSQSSVVVDLEAKPIAPVEKSEDAIAKRVEQTISDKYDKLIKSLENQLAGARRIIEKQEGQLKQQPAKELLPQPVQQTQQQQVDELDKLVNDGNWKKAVEILAERKAQEVIQGREAQRKLEEDFRTRQETLEESKNEVIAVYPELDPEKGEPDSEVSTLYTEVLNENPGYLSDPYGPILAARRMEQILLERGVDTTKRYRALLQGGNTPLNPPRQPSLGAASLAPGRISTASGKYILSKEQKELCDRNNIPYDTYAKFADTLDKTGEVTI